MNILNIRHITLTNNFQEYLKKPQKIFLSSFEENSTLLIFQ